MLKKRLLFLLSLLVVLAAGLSLFTHFRGAAPEALTLYGNVDIRTVNLSFRVPGRLQTLFVDEGDQVRAGQELGALASDTFENALLQARANVEQRKASLSLLREGYRSEEVAQVRSQLAQYQADYEYAVKNYARLQSVVGQGAVSKNEVDKAKSASEAAAAALRAARDKLAQYETGNRAQEIQQAGAALLAAEAVQAQAELNLTDARLVAPSDGTILTRTVEPGTMLQAGGPVFTLSLTRPVWVRAYIDEVNLAWAMPGTAVELYADVRPGYVYKGSIGFVSPTAEFTPKAVQTPELRTALVYRLRIIVANPDDLLRQGMPVTVKLPRGVSPPTMEQGQARP